MEEKIRLQKAIADKGYCSRRKAETLIKEGKVKVNGKLILTMGFLVSNDDHIEVEGITKKEGKKVAFLFYKPEGVITSSSDDRNRKIVLDYFKNEPYRLYPSGRLDYFTSGALIVTNDGELSALLTHPSSHLDKTYEAKIKGKITQKEIDILENGIILDDGPCEKAKVEILKIDDDYTTLNITIHEGRNRQVRRMFLTLGHKVLALKRISIGFLALGELKKGEYRMLKEEEIALLKKECLFNKQNNIIPSYKINAKRN